MWAVHGISAISCPRDNSPWASVGSKDAGAAQVKPRRQHATSPYTPGKEKTEARKANAEVGENLHIRKTIIISHVPALPWDLLDVSWKLNSAGRGAGTSKLDSWVLGQPWQDFSHPPSPAKEICYQCQPRASTGTHTLAPIKSPSCLPSSHSWICSW